MPGSEGIWQGCFCKGCSREGAVVRLPLLAAADASGRLPCEHTRVAVGATDCLPGCEPASRARCPPAAGQHLAHLTGNVDCAVFHQARLPLHRHPEQDRQVAQCWRTRGLMVKCDLMTQMIRFLQTRSHELFHVANFREFVSNGSFDHPFRLILPVLKHYHSVILFSVRFV